MYEQKEKPKENKRRTVANTVAQKKSNGMQGLGFVDNRPEAVINKISQYSSQRRLVTESYQKNSSNIQRQMNGLTHAQHIVQRVSSLAGNNNVIQLQKTSIAIFSQSHNDTVFFDKIKAEIELLIKSKIPFTIVIEEPPGVTAQALLERCNTVLEDKEKFYPESVAICEAEKPIYEFFVENKIDITGVDSPEIKNLNNTDSLNKKLGEMEFSRLQAMSNGILGTAANLSKKGGGLVLGIQFGKQHITGLMYLLKTSIDQMKIKNTEVKGVMGTGGYKDGKVLEDGKRSAEKQGSHLKDIKEASKLYKKLKSVIDNFYEDKTRENLNLSIIGESEYATKIKEIIEKAKEYATSKGGSNQQVDIRFVVNDSSIGHGGSALTEPLLGKEEGTPKKKKKSGFCCCVIQ